MEGRSLTHPDCPKGWRGPLFGPRDNIGARTALACHDSQRALVCLYCWALFPVAPDVFERQRANLDGRAKTEE